MFIFENGEAIDREKDAVVKKIRRFYDSDFVPYYEYKMIFDGNEYLFNVSFYSESVDYKDNFGKNHQKRMIFIAYVLEDRLRKSVFGVRNKVGLPPITDLEYLKLRQMVADGIFCLGSRGGYHLKFVPSFHVDFVDDWKQVPPSKCRLVKCKA